MKEITVHAHFENIKLNNNLHVHKIKSLTNIAAFPEAAAQKVFSERLVLIQIIFIKYVTVDAKQQQY